MVNILDDLATKVAWAIKTIKIDRGLDRGIKDVDLAKILGTNKNTIANYREGRGLFKGDFLDRLISVYNFNPMWLFKGQGEPFSGARKKYPEVCGPEEDTPLYKEGDLIERIAEPVAEYGGGVDDFGKAAAGLKEIFDSHDPVLIPAIQSNIRAFQISVRRERHIQQQASKISTLEEENANIKSRLDTIEKHLPPSGENTEKKVI